MFKKLFKIKFRKKLLMYCICTGWGNSDVGYLDRTVVIHPLLIRINDAISKDCVNDQVGSGWSMYV